MKAKSHGKLVMLMNAPTWIGVALLSLLLSQGLTSGVFLSTASLNHSTLFYYLS